MADATYAWSDIRTTDDKGATKLIKFGEAVTAAGLGVDKENFEALIESGAVRNVKPPDLAKEGFSGSVVEFYQNKAREAAEEAGATAAEAAVEAMHAVGEV
jgi:hypothetical protein